MLTKVPLVCDKALRKMWDFTMLSPSTGRRRSGQIPANRRPGPAGRGRGSTLRSLGVDSWARLGRGRACEVGAPAASGGGRREHCAGEVWGRRVWRRARVGAGEGGGELGLGVQPAGARAHRGCLHWHRRRAVGLRRSRRRAGFIGGEAEGVLASLLRLVRH
jgi:hypothetical protein